jgi:hypothetical protein
MKLTGHKTEAVYRRYAIVAESDLREAGAKLAAALGTAAATASLSGSFGEIRLQCEIAFAKCVKEWWAGTGLNRRHQDFQSYSPGRVSARNCLMWNKRLPTASYAGVCCNDQECA